ncbi:hypothetical protein C7212DRAFT_349023, partial [Tuber magnatum]
GSDCYEATNEAGYESVDRYGDTRVYEREDDVGDGKPVALSQGNIGIDSYGDDDHRWGRDGDNGIKDNDKDSDEDDGDDVDKNENESEDEDEDEEDGDGDEEDEDDDGEDEDDDEEDKDDDEEDEDDDEESEDDDGDDEDDYQGAGERMDKDGAGAEQGYHDGYQNYCGNGGHQGDDIGTYQKGIDISQRSGVFGADVGMGHGDMWYSVDIPGGHGVPGGLPVEQAMAGALGNAVIAML